MARPGITREQVFETADALVREGRNLARPNPQNFHDRKLNSLKDT
jgi:hypothetical protein